MKSPDACPEVQLDIFHHFFQHQVICVMIEGSARCASMMKPLTYCSIDNVSKSNCEPSLLYTTSWVYRNLYLMEELVVHALADLPLSASPLLQCHQRGTLQASLIEWLLKEGWSNQDCCLPLCLSWPPWLKITTPCERR